MEEKQKETAPEAAREKTEDERIAADEWAAHHPLAPLPAPPPLPEPPPELTEEERIEADAQQKFAETKRLYAAARHDDAVAARVQELIKDSDLPPPASLDQVVENMTNNMLGQAKHKHCENVARSRAMKLFKDWLNQSGTPQAEPESDPAS